MKPNGRVEVKEKLVRHEVKQEVVEATRETHEAPKERPAVAKGLVRHIALQKSIAVQAALLADPRKAKEVTAVSILLAFGPSHPISIEMHECITGCEKFEMKPKAFTMVRSQLSEILGRVMRRVDDSAPSTWVGGSEDTPVELYKAIQTLSNEDLDRLIALLVLLSF